MEAGQSRRVLFGTLSLASVVVGVAGWLPLVLSAALAMGTAAHSTVALVLGLAGLAVAALAGAFAFVVGGATAARIAVVVWLVPFAIFFLVGYAKLRARFKAA